MPADEENPKWRRRFFALSIVSLGIVAWLAVLTGYAVTRTPAEVTQQQLATGQEHLRSEVSALELGSLQTTASMLVNYNGDTVTSYVAITGYDLAAGIVPTNATHPSLPAALQGTPAGNRQAYEYTVLPGGGSNSMRLFLTTDFNYFCFLYTSLSDESAADYVPACYLVDASCRYTSFFGITVQNATGTVYGRSRAILYLSYSTLTCNMI
jgi:hypothetical protein